ncbi:MAG: hypothetical protein WBM17_07520 [Anaerolineales bacterium]
MKVEHTYQFTCQSCSGHIQIVTHVWSALAGTSSERWQEWGPLYDNHHWRYRFKEKIEKNEDDEVHRGDVGAYEEDDSSSEPEEYEVNEAETNRENDEFFVNCENGDREIEFGWSHPERRGLILPVESSDFNPSETWPDPKYSKAWRKKGWGRTKNADTA